MLKYSVIFINVQQGKICSHHILTKMPQNNAIFQNIKDTPHFKELKKQNMSRKIIIKLIIMTQVIIIFNHILIQPQSSFFIQVTN